MWVRSRSLTKSFSGHPDECGWLLGSQRSLTVPAQVVRLGNYSTINETRS